MSIFRSGLSRATVAAVGLVVVASSAFVGAPAYASAASALPQNAASGSFGAVATAVADQVKPEVSRIAGADRFASAVAASGAWAPGVDSLFIVNGVSYADALSAGPAAAHQNAPLLLVAPDSVPDVVMTEIKRLRPHKVIIIGGENAVSRSVGSRIGREAGVATVERYSGTDRFRTSQEVASYIWRDTLATEAFLATGFNFPDALSAGAAGAALDAPVILVDPRQPADYPLTATLNGLGVESVLAVGGQNAVPDAFLDSVDEKVNGEVYRISGDDRFQTSAAIADAVFEQTDIAYLAVGTNFPDALTGTALAGKTASPLFTVRQNCIPAVVNDALVSHGVRRVVLLGGENALSRDVEALTVCA